MTFIVDCDRCSFKEKTNSYERATDIYDSHHITTGHRPPINECGQSGKFVVDCDRCDYREKTDSYERAKSLKDNHHIPTGHHPIINER